MRSVADFRTDQALAAGLICYDLSLAKQDAIRIDIKNCLPVQEARMVEELPIEVFELMHEQLGLSFVVKAGKIIGVNHKDYC